jgi:CheY-like chemotaxis protein
MGAVMGEAPRIVEPSTNFHRPARRAQKVMKRSMLAARLLKAMQARVGWDLALLHRPDLALLDLIMPGIDGCALLDRLWMDDGEMLPGTFRA